MSNELRYIEFECKYKTKDHILIQFKQLIENINKPKNFFYLEGPDLMFTYPKWWFDNNPQWDPEGTFIRYRKPSYGLDGNRRQVTWKYKPTGSTNNIQRTEMNWDVTKVSEENILKQLELSGATFNFSIVKNCHIYSLDDATLVFYTVYDTTGDKISKPEHFIEIEVNEEKIADMTEEQAWNIIEEYEKILKPIGVSAKKRLDKSLFQMYVRR